MNFNKRKLLKKIKRHLVKKTIVQKTYINNNLLCLDIALKNFLYIKDIKAVLTFHGEEEELQYRRDNKKLTITIPLNQFNKFDTKATIQLKINNKKMWLITSKEDNIVNSYIINNKYYYIRVDKHIIIQSLFSEYQFSQEPIEITSISSSYNRLELTTKNDIPNLSDLSILAAKHKKIRFIDCVNPSESNILELENFQNLALGVWRVFLKVDNTLYALLMDEKMNTKFDTLNHQIEVESYNNELYLAFSNHFLPTNTLSIKRNDERIDLEMEVNDQDREATYTLIMEDTILKHDYMYSLERKQQKFFASIPIADIIGDFSNKRFFVLRESSIEEHNFKYQFYLEDASQLNTNGLKEVQHQAQLIPIKFYRRKDKSLGIRMKKPKLRKMIESIDDFTFSGFLKGLDRFIDCQFYLVLQDRNTEDQIMYPITEKFDISIKVEDLVEMKGKEKTVIDFFIVVRDRHNNEIRKEKIKYKSADYKKDNYYDYLKGKDERNNTHHFLVTTTPFNNLKVESFMVPKDVLIPEEPAAKDPNIWLLGERYNTAQDNGFALFKWLQNNTDIDAYYVIEEDAEDYLALEDKTNVLRFGSKEHFEIAIKAKVLLGTHDLENLLPYKPAKGFFGYENTTKVFLQHGVLGRKRVEYHKKYYEQPFDLFIVSSYPEKYDVVVDQLGYNEEEVAVTGLARFDNLPKDHQPKDILLMPTWRDWINTDEQFLSSQYYNFYSNLINNEELHQLLEKYDVYLNFYPHYRAQDFFAKDIGHDNTRVRFIPLGSKSVQQLLIDHALLITDYSSVSFDFTLMNKPVIFYHFDVKRFFRRGILRPVEETFLGEITTNEEDMMVAIKDRLENNFQNYDIDISNIIEYQDNHNSERIYQAVRDKLQNT